MPRAATPSPAAAQTAEPRARPNATQAATDRTAAAAAEVEDRAKCSRPPARAVATRPRCRSNPAATSPSIARRASSSAAVEAAVVAVAGTAQVAGGRGHYYVHVEPREGESFDQFLRRFKTSMDKSGILREYKRKRYFKSNGELQREKAKAAARRRTKRFRGPRPLRIRRPLRMYMVDNRRGHGLPGSICQPRLHSRGESCAYAFDWLGREWLRRECPAATCPE